MMSEKLKQLYDESMNPTPLMFEFLNDLQKSGLYDVLKKYHDILSPHEVVGFITSELHCESARITILKRIANRKPTREGENE